MPSVSLPQKPKYVSIGEQSGKFEILGCYPGYGTTLGNALRRVILSSLEGSAVTAVKIKGATHEFSTLPGIMEDMVQVILNVKKIRFKTHGDDPVKVGLKHKGEGKITAEEMKCPAGTEVINPDQLIATATDKKSDLDMELEVNKGLGYIPVEQQERKEKEIGTIAVDAIYTPVKRVNYEIENMRVGKRTDYDKITLEVVTDGTVTPSEAFRKAVSILVEQFSKLLDIETAGEKKEEEKKEKIPASEKEMKGEVSGELAPVDPLKIRVADLRGLSTRTLNVLETNKIAKVKDIIKINEGSLISLPGMGAKGIKEIKKAVGEFGLTLKQSA